MTGGSQWQQNGKTHYERNRQWYINRAQERKHSLKSFVDSVKKQGSCVDCSNSDYRVLEFDHLPQFKKDKNISLAWQLGWGLERIKNEIAKCELRCANCHRLKTLERKSGV